ncbi:MAG: hypothetical protein ACKPBA_02650 [Planctomycetota bacterium]
MRHGDHLIATWVGHCLDHPDDRHVDRRNVHQGVRLDDRHVDYHVDCHVGCRGDHRRHDAGVDHHHRHASAGPAVPMAQNHQQNDAGVDHHHRHVARAASQS